MGGHGPWLIISQKIIDHILRYGQTNFIKEYSDEWEVSNIRKFLSKFKVQLDKFTLLSQKIIDHILMI